jgi:hypothetical protein
MKSSAENVLKVQRALEDAGVIFIDQNDDRLYNLDLFIRQLSPNFS